MATRSWSRRRTDKADRLAAVAAFADGGVIDARDMVAVLQAVLRPGDRVALEGDNQKQADFLAGCLGACDPAVVRDLHMLISSVSLREHLDLFERGIATRLDLAYAGPQSLRLAQMIEDGALTIGAIHTYVELYARMFVDLTPRVALLCAEQADRQCNLYTGPNTEDTPTIAEATAFRDGIVIVQVNELADELPRVDIPGDWVDLVVVSPRPHALEPLFTRDPRQIGPVEVLKAMLALRGVYERHEVTSLNHGIGFDTATIELLLPTYGERLGLKGRICRHWALNPHPTLSGGFLAHGLQANQVLALDDPGVEIHAMHKPAAARITRRSVGELERLAALVPPLSYDVRDWESLGLCDGLIAVTDADRPSAADIATVRSALGDAVQRARGGPRDLKARLESPAAQRTRDASRRARDLLAAQWTDEADGAA